MSAGAPLTWIVIGATSGLARAFIRQVALRGDALVLVGRRESDLLALAQDALIRGAGAAQVLVSDLTSGQMPAQMAALAEQISGPIGVYCAAGLMPDEAQMRQNPALCAQMMATNYSGPVTAINALLGVIEQRPGSRIILIGSVAGDRGRKKNHLYGSSKAGLAAYAQGLAAYLSAAGIPVLLVKPGVMDTEMTWGQAGPPLPKGSPDALAKACLKRAGKGGTLYFPAFWAPIMLMIKHLPRVIFNRLNF